jgi:type I restriction enzyme S subunit
MMDGAESWDVRPLGSLLLRPPRYGVNAAAVALSPGVPTYLRITDIDDEGNFSPSPKVGVSHPKSSDYVIRLGELVFARTGASVGKSYRYNHRDGELVYAGFLINIAPDPKQLDPRYLSLLVHTKEYWDWIARTSVRSGQPGVNGREYARLPVLLPDIATQDRIAVVMGDVDELVDTLERLITKTQAIKEGTMQELLTGRTRLPRFTGRWERQRLGELGLFLKGRGIRREDVCSSGIPCIRYGELYTTYRGYVSRPLTFVSTVTAASALPLRAGDLLFAASGETKKEIGLCVAYTGSAAAVAGGDVIVLRGANCHPVFLAAAVNAPDAVSQKASFGQGDAVVHISSNALSAVEVDLPPRPEQDAIAAVLLDLDAELRALTKRLEKARAIKRGMIQELLAGRARIPAGAAVS